MEFKIAYRARFHIVVFNPLFASGSILFYLFRFCDVAASIKIQGAPWSGDKDECSHIILVGSETGTTYALLKRYKGLTKQGKGICLKVMPHDIQQGRAAFVFNSNLR